MTKKFRDMREQMEKMFGGDIADPNIFPMVFAYQVKLAEYELFLKSLQENENGNT